MEGLCPETTIQEYPWENDEGRGMLKHLMSIMDGVNGRFGRGTLEVAASGGYLLMILKECKCDVRA